MSPYEALSLVVSSVGTLGTVYIGMRQLRHSAPQRAPGPAPAPAYHAPAPAYRSPGPSGHPAPYGPVHRPPPVRPASVTAASVVLFVAATAHPFTVALYYTIRFVSTPSVAAAEFGGEGILDVLVFGGVAFASALLGLFVTRGSRVALWSVWVLGALSVVLLCLVGSAATLAALAPGADRLGGFELLFIGYLAFVLVAYAVGAVLLLTTGSRAFFRRP